MHQAAAFGMIELVQHCLDRNCQVDAITTQGPAYPRRFGDFPGEMTPLAYACAEGHVKIVDLLLKEKASFELENPNSAILWTAGYQGHAEVVDLLLRRFKETHTPEETAEFIRKRPSPKAGLPTLWAAGSSGKADAVKVLISQGAEYESNWFNATPLNGAAYFGCPSVVELFLDYQKKEVLDIRIDQQDRNGRTALYEACTRKQPAIARMLLDAGADYLIPEKDNTTPLQRSCFNGMFAVVSAIVVKASHELERSDFLVYLNTQHRSTGNTALIDCTSQNRLSCLNLLLDHGADYKISGNGDCTILHMASRHDNSAIMAAIVGKASRDLDHQQFLNFLNTRHSSGKTALVDCAERGRVEAAKILLQNGADYQIAGHAGRTPLAWACTGGHAEVVKLILKHAKSHSSEGSPLSDCINKANKDGWTPLMHAAFRNHLPVVKVLLEYGADYTTSRVGKKPPTPTALHDACSSGSREVVTHLLEVASKELDEEQLARFVNKRNQYEKTPLHDAADSGRPRIVELLLSKYNADPMTSKHGNVSTLLDANWNGHVEVVSLLLKYASRNPDTKRFKDYMNQRNKWLKTVLMDACERNRPEVIRLLLEYGADYSIGNNENVTPLHKASWNGHPEAAETLLELASKDPDRPRFASQCLNRKNKWGKTPLMDACETGRPQVARILLKYGADYRLDDGKGFTALHYCAFRNRINCVRVLLEYAHHHQGAKGFEEFINQQGRNNKASALHDAARQGHTDVVKLLLEYKPVYDSLDSGKRNPLHQAIGTNNADLAKAILEYASRDGDKERLKRFVNAPDENGDTAWKGATRRKMQDVVDALKATGIVQM